MGETELGLALVRGIFSQIQRFGEEIEEHIKQNKKEEEVTCSLLRLYFKSWYGFIWEGV